MPPRRKWPSTHQTDLPAAKLYIEDLEDVLAAIRGLPDHDRVTIDVDNYEFDEPGQIAELGQRSVKSLTIRSGLVDYPTVYVWRMASVVVTQEDALQQRGVASIIYDIFNRRRRPIRSRLVSATAVASALGLLSFTAALILAIDVHKAFAAELAAAIGSTAATFVLAAAAFIYELGTTSVMTTYRSERTTLWSRNRDQIILNAFFAVLGAILGSVGTALLHR